MSFNSAASNSENRIALIIGNAGYQYTRRLKNTQADSASIVAALAEAGFKSHVKCDDGTFSPLRYFENSTLIEMKRLLGDFGEAAHQVEMAIVYYSGHGIEINFRNFLIPVDAQIPHVARVSHEAVPLSDVIEATFGASRLRLVILDACRDNPFLERMKGLDLSKTTSTKGGLGEPKNPGSAWVFYAATEGQVAREGPDGGMSPFADSLSRRLREQDREMFRVLGKVSEDVQKATVGTQHPRFYGAPPADDIFLYPKKGEVEQSATLERSGQVEPPPLYKSPPSQQKKVVVPRFSFSLKLTISLSIALIAAVPAIWYGLDPRSTVPKKIPSPTFYTVQGPKVRITSGGTSDGHSPFCLKRTVQSCAKPEHGGRLIPSSGSAADVSTSGRVGSSIVVDSPEMICIEFWAATSACETEVSIEGHVTAREQVDAAPTRP
jgi:hypothetical protein